ncbi:hypothetical protein [Caldinitratiruptor microaerophilus]|uniref:Uncharacterized protein n=1 Tax=Caldinitratiruptor microaerophilus TaxID=671077 RepID=A0AA35CM61_9FIRM|nr:hypothetical protein [Caldinitratiruptor microaerophilus]BDG60928.1 hypothetical protein caldi_20180 [Caldinitratiruptor microaerophilus]
MPASAFPSSAPTLQPVSVSPTARVVIPAGQFTCLTGFVTRRPAIGIPFAGTHLLVGLGGQVIASLESTIVNLEALVGQFVTLCGVSRGEIEGVTAVNVTSAFASPFGISPLQVPFLSPLLQWFLLQQFLLSALQGQPGAPGALGTPAGLPFGA